MSVKYKQSGTWKDISSSSNNAVDTVADGNMNPVTSNAVYDALQHSITELTPTISLTNGNSTRSGHTIDSYAFKAYVNERTGLVHLIGVVTVTTTVLWDAGHVSLGFLHGLPYFKCPGTYTACPMYKSGLGRAVNGFINLTYGQVDLGDLGFKFPPSEPFAVNSTETFNINITYMSDLSEGLIP